MLAAPVAGLVQRSQLALKFSNCASASAAQTPDADVSLSLLDSPTQLQLGSGPTRAFRGAVVGNTLMFLGCCVLCAAYGWLRRAPETSFARTLASVRLPGRLYVVYALLLQPTVTACVTLMALGAGATDVVLGVAGAVLLVCGLVVPAQWVRHGCRELVAAEGVRRSGTLLDAIFGARVRWAPQPPPADVDVVSADQQRDAAELFSLQAEKLIGKCHGGRQLYFVYGALMSVVSGGIGVLNPRDGVAVCKTAQYALLAVSVLSVVLLVWLRPYASPTDLAVNTTLEALTCAASIVVISGAVGAASPLNYTQLGIAVALSICRMAYLMWSYRERSVEGLSQASTSLCVDSVPIDSLRLDVLVPQDTALKPSRKHSYVLSPDAAVALCMRYLVEGPPKGQQEQWLRLQTIVLRVARRSLMQPHRSYRASLSDSLLEPRRGR